MSRHSRSLLTLATLSLLLKSATSTCFWPTGNETYAADLTEHMPCSNDTSSPLSTICCALNRTNPSGGDKRNGRTNDECLPNGVCRNRVLDHGTMQISYWRETCTEKDWKTGLCLDICSDDWTSGNGTTGAIMTPCDGTERSLRWCCGVGTECCTDESKVKVLPFEFRGALPNTASATPRPLPSETSTTSTPSSTAPSEEQQDANENRGGGTGGLSTGAKAGIGVGAAVGGLMLLGLGFFIARRTGRNHGGQSHKAEMSGEGAYGHVGPPAPMEKEQYRHELEHSPRPELEYVPASAGQKKQPLQEMP